MPVYQGAAVRGLVLAYGAGTLAGQVLILRELLVLCQGQELKLALGLWCWLLWTGLGSLGGGRLAARYSPNLDSLAILLFLLGWFLPGAILGARLLPVLLSFPAGQSLGPGAALVLFLILLAPFGLTSGCFFPFACKFQRTLDPQGAIGRIYATEALGAAAGIGLLQIVLLGQYANLSLSLGAGLILITLAALLTRQPKFLLGVLVLGFALHLAPQLELQSRQWQWPGRGVVATVDSPYALLTVTKEKEQLSFFANHVWHFTHPDPYSAEHAVHLALLEHPRPERVLLLGGGVAGLVPEILKHKSVNRLHYVELDPDLVRLAAHQAPDAAQYLAGDPRVEIFHQDARRFLALTDNRYDVIILGLPEPTNAQLNRYYSQEFFQIVFWHLKPKGVFSFALSGGGGASLNPVRAAYLALSYNTLGRVFPEVLVFPGEQVRFFASPTQGTLAAGPEVLVARLQDRHLNLRYVREYFLLADLAPSRQQYLSAILKQQPVEVNTDLNPRGYFYDLVLTGAREGLPLREVLLTLKNLPPFAPWLALGLTFLLAWLIMRTRPGLCALTQVLVMGLGTMALEVSALVLYQVYLGYLYRQLGLLIAAFMLGLATGGTWWVRFQAEPQRLARRLAALQLGLAALPFVLSVLLLISGKFSWVPPEIFLQGGFILLLALAGFAGGGIFSLCATLWRQTRPTTAFEGGLFYAVDLLGATLGTLGMSLLIMPVWGIVPALLGLAALHTFAALLLVKM
jgi:spermidine synthase